MGEWIAGLVLLYLVVGAVAHRLHLLLFPPPGSLFPAPGAILRSASEGFTQQILAVEGNRLWSRLTLDPRAPGPPPHVHSRFAERFRVTSGRIELELASGTVALGAGEEHLVAPGTRHRLRNPADEPAVVEGPTTDERFALPRAFGLFLVQAYGFFDERPENSRPPRALLQMSFWSPLFDVWLPGPPIAAQRVLFALVRPVALALGYRPWYRRFAPPAPAAGPATPAAAPRR